MDISILLPLLSFYIHLDCTMRTKKDAHDQPRNSNSQYSRKYHRHPLLLIYRIFLGDASISDRSSRFYGDSCSPKYPLSTSTSNELLNFLFRRTGTSFG